MSFFFLLLFAFLVGMAWRYALRTAFLMVDEIEDFLRGEQKPGQ